MKTTTTARPESIFALFCRPDPTYILTEVFRAQNGMTRTHPQLSHICVTRSTDPAPPPYARRAQNSAVNTTIVLRSQERCSTR
jgi:hypothetical protein